MKRIIFFPLLCAAALPVAAHDFWIEPSTFRPAAGQTVAVSLLVGQDFTGEVLPRSQQLIDSFTVVDARGERPVNGFENADPAGYVRVEREGTEVIGYRSKANPLELSAEKFNEFARQEELNVAPATRPYREHFFRYAKAIVGAGRGFDRPLGYRLEIVPESLDGSVRVVFEGRPLVNALVRAIHRDDATLRLAARTDAAGRVHFNLPKNGVWLITSVRWSPGESLWASLTFER